MGGVHARAGFRLQDLWIAFNLLDWVRQDDFRGFKDEGVDDVDVSLFQEGRRTGPFDWKYYQLKDTLVTLAVLSKVLELFRRKHARFPRKRRAITWSQAVAPRG